MGVEIVPSNPSSHSGCQNLHPALITAACCARAPIRLVYFSLLLLILCGSAQAETFDDHFAIVFIDRTTESKYGDVPLDREILAKGIVRMSEAGAKGVVIKFFLDQAKDDAGDRILAEAITRLPVILQARIDSNEPSSKDLPDRFTLSFDADTSITGNAGSIPLPLFSREAYDIDFTDFNGFPLALLETYQGKTVKSLLLSAIELALGAKAIIKPGHQVNIGQLKLKMNALNQVDVDLKSLPALRYIPFHEVLDDASRTVQVKDKVVILAYDGPKIHSIKTKSGSVSAHKMYSHVLSALLRDGL